MQRPPLMAPPVSAALLVYLSRNVPVKKSKQSPRRSNREQASRPAASTPPAQNQPQRRIPTPPIQKQPVPSSSITYGMNGSKGSNGNNGSNGHAARSSIFQPGAFPSTSSSTRLPHKPASPAQTPWETNRWPKPATQTGQAPAKSGAENEQTQSKPQVASPQEGKPPSQPAPPQTAPSQVAPQQPLPQPAPARTPERPVMPAPRLVDFLKRHPELPSETTLFGVCEDGLPVLLDLNDPTPGAVLAMGDERDKMIDLLRSSVASMASRNSPRSVQILVLARDPASWLQWIAARGFERHFLAVESSEGDLVREWVLQLADWTEQRRLGQRSGPPVLLLMDTLSFLPRLTYDVRMNFDWMLKEGPQARIWPIATISTELAKVLQGRRMLRAFQTRILGCASDPADYIQLAGLREEEVGGFSGSGQFAVQLGEDWLRFRLFDNR